MNQLIAVFGGAFLGFLVGVVCTAFLVRRNSLTWTLLVQAVIVSAVVLALEPFLVFTWLIFVVPIWGLVGWFAAAIRSERQPTVREILGRD